MGKCGNYATRRDLGNLHFHNVSNLTKKNVNDLGRNRSSVREESAAARMNLRQIFENVSEQRKN